MRTTARRADGRSSGKSWEAAYRDEQQIPFDFAQGRLSGHAALACRNDNALVIPGNRYRSFREHSNAPDRPSSSPLESLAFPVTEIALSVWARAWAGCPCGPSTGRG